MMILNSISLQNEKGAAAVYAALVLALLFGFAALAVDVNYLYGVRNELHNAADSGALAGAGELINDDSGLLTVQAAIDEATRITTANKTGTQSVVEMVIETGHWSFTNSEFTANPATTQAELDSRTYSELDLDPNVINAVRVRADRSDTPSFFANLLGFDQFFVSADAVAWLGFAGSFFPGDFDQPIAICKESITDPDDPDGGYTCSMGRMLNSGGNVITHNTGGWTNFTQPCETAGASDMRALICESGNLNELEFGKGMGTIGGVQDTTIRDLYDCWVDATERKVNWTLTLPVIECPGNNVSNCSTLVGAVKVELIWIIERNDPHYNDVPQEMTAPGFDFWTCDAAEVGGYECWKSFVDHFGIENVDGPPGTREDYEFMYQNKNFIFLSSCEDTKPKGNSGGQYYGIWADIPSLVE